VDGSTISHRDPGYDRRDGDEKSAVARPGFRYAVAAAHDGVALVFVMNIDKPGRHAVPAVNVSYHIDGTRF
jgi:hypothetical protein